MSLASLWFKLSVLLLASFFGVCWITKLCNCLLKNKLLHFLVLFIFVTEMLISVQRSPFAFSCPIIISDSSGTCVCVLCHSQKS